MQYNLAKSINMIEQAYIELGIQFETRDIFTLGAFLQHLFWLDTVVVSPKSSWVRSGGLAAYIHDFFPGFIKHYAKVNYLLPEQIDRTVATPSEKLNSFVKEALQIIWER